MENYGITHERISDYGLRKLLCIKTPSGANFAKNCTKGKDTFMLTRNKIKHFDDKKTTNIAFGVVSVMSIIGLITLGLKRLGAVKLNIKNHSPKILDKFKTLFKK